MYAIIRIRFNEIFIWILRSKINIKHRLTVIVSCIKYLL
uniref:Uncharacterized protein n=1 Tax=Setaria italica TaxID=4555 RepID=K4A3X6_SETIT